MKRIPRRLFTEEFKREAIKLFTEQHFNVAAAGRQFVLIRNLFALKEDFPVQFRHYWMSTEFWEVQDLKGYACVPFFYI